MYRLFVGKHEGKRPLGTLRRRWEDGIRMDLPDVSWVCVCVCVCVCACARVCVMDSPCSG
jgi:hypothetical protein